VTDAHYEIVIRGRLGDAAARWFDDLDVRPAGPDATRITGWFADQAALQGLLSRLGELGVELSSLRRLEPD
jgi:hypothetical protein